VCEVGGPKLGDYFSDDYSDKKHCTLGCISFNFRGHVHSETVK